MIINKLRWYRVQTPLYKGVFYFKGEDCMNYKETLHLPKTDFEMRGNLAKKEPAIQQRWEDEKLYEEMLNVREGAPLFSLHDGPPYANGNIHIGHALNKVLKDILVRSKFMAGFKTPFRPGWDTHGLPIETAIQKLGVNRKEMPVHEFRKLCEEYALKQVAIQTADFKALGTVADYENPYLTLSKDFEAKQIEIFGEMALKGMIYQGLKPVYWSPSSETALAEAEIEYKERRDPAIYVAFKVVDGKDVLDTDTNFVIWTTTPWTIPANLAISLNPNMEYSLVDTNKGKMILMTSLIEDVSKSLELEDIITLKTMKGSELEGVTTQHPLYDRLSPILMGDHVTAEAGTGSVHTAPDHGVDDFNVAQKYDIHPISPVNAQGILTEVTGEFAGLTFEEANKAVTMKLEELGALLKMGWIKHSYAHDWRTKLPIIYRATTQWFASIDSVRADVLSEIEKVEWHPKWGQKRMHNMIADRGDWCISRQRVWGVPIPIIYAEDETPIMDKVVFDHIVELVKEFGSNVWFERDVLELLPEGYTHPGSPNGIFKKEKDIMDVWFDSGSSHSAALDNNEIPLPVDVYSEGADQFRGWFNSSLIISVALYGIAPYKNVIAHGFLMQDDGEKMSKSKGNALSPQKINETLGADILRLWVTSLDYHADMSLSQDILKQVSESYRKIRNTFRFMHGNLADFNAETDSVTIAEMSILNRYVLNEVIELNAQAQKDYAKFDYQRVTTAVLTALTNLMSAYYLDYTKDILYIEAVDNASRREIQTVLHTSLNILARLMSPILVHTTEELQSIMNPNESSIHLTEFSDMKESVLTEEETDTMNRLFKFRESVFKALEVKREEKVIGKSLEAHVKLHLSDELKKDVETVCGEHLAQWLIVSKVTLVDETLEEILGLEIEVEANLGETCPRCWNIVDSTDEDGLCDRCHSVLKA